MVTYSQYPGLAMGPSAQVVIMSKITPAAPPCMTLLMLQYAGVILSEKVADERMAGSGIANCWSGVDVLVDGCPTDASSRIASDISRLSKPLYFSLSTTSQYLCRELLRLDMEMSLAVLPLEDGFHGCQGLLP